MTEILFERINKDTTIKKNAADVVDFVINYKQKLQSDTISSRTVTGDGVTIDSTSESGNKVTITMSGGNEGDIAEIKASVTTAAGKVYKRLINIKIEGD